LGDLIIDEIKKRKFILKTPVRKNERAGIISFYGSFDSSLLKDSLYKKNVIINLRDGAIRVAPHFYNTEDDINELFKNIDEIL